MPAGRPKHSGETIQRGIRLPADLWTRVDALVADLQAKLPIKLTRTDGVRLLLDRSLADLGHGERIEADAMLNRIAQRAPVLVEELDRDKPQWWIDLFGFSEPPAER